MHNRDLRHAVAMVALANMGYFFVEFAMARHIGSVSLFADSVDFLEDAAVNLLVFFALAWSARRRARVRACLEAVLPLARSEAASAPLEESLVSRRIAAALTALTDAERAAFVLFELEGLSGKEIANILGCPEATVFRRLFHARQRFTAAVEAHGGFEP